MSKDNKDPKVLAPDANGFPPVYDDSAARVRTDEAASASRTAKDDADRKKS